MISKKDVEAHCLSALYMLIGDSVYDGDYHNCNFESLGIDSIDIVGVLNELESYYDIKFNQEDIGSIKALNTMVTKTLDKINCINHIVHHYHD